MLYFIYFYVSEILQEMMTVLSKFWCVLVLIFLKQMKDCLDFLSVIYISMFKKLVISIPYAFVRHGFFFVYKRK